MEYAAEKGYQELKLHFGCGGENLEGYINIDYYKPEGDDTSRTGFEPDLVLDMRTVELADESVDEILTVHTMEHFVRWEAVELVGKFHRWLKPGGRLVTEMPDLDRCIHFYLNKLGQLQKTPLGELNCGFTQFFGNQWNRHDYETHRYVWTAREFEQVLKEAGFSEVVVGYDARYHMPERDMFVEAVK